MKRRFFLLTLLAATALHAADEPVPRDEKNLSFRNELRDPITRGLAWLKTQQNEDGSFGKDVAHPALSALPLLAFLREPTGKFAKADFVQKSAAYLRGFAQPDGGIYSTRAASRITTRACASWRSPQRAM